MAQCSRCGEEFRAERAPSEHTTPQTDSREGFPSSDSIAIADERPSGEQGASTPRVAAPIAALTDSTRRISARDKPLARNRLVGGIVLGVMILMGGIGLTYALWTVQTRREHDKALPRSSRRPLLPAFLGKPSSEPTLPARLDALNYLPAGCTFVAAVHGGDLLDSPIYERLKALPLKIGPTEWGELGKGGLPFLAPIREWSLDVVEQWLGIPAGNIDHLAVGSVLETEGVATLTPPTVLVIRTRDAVGINRLRETLHAGTAREKPTPDGATRLVSSARMKDVPLNLWIPNANTVVLGLFTDFQTIPSKPSHDHLRIATETRQLIEQRLTAGTVAWVALSVSDWKASPLLSVVPGLKSLPWGERSDAVKALAIGVPRERPLRIQMAIRASNIAQLEESAVKDRRMKTAREGEWLTIQFEP